MSLSTLALAIWLFLLGLVWAFSVNISSEFLGWWALATAVLMFLEGLSVFTYSVPARRQ